MGRAIHLLGETMEHIVAAFLIAVAATLVVPSWRASKGYFLAAWAVGVVGGLAGQRIGIPPGWDILFTAGAVITAPATILALQGRTLIEVVDLVRDRVRDRAGSDEDRD